MKAEKRLKLIAKKIEAATKRGNRDQADKLYQQEFAPVALRIARRKVRTA